MSDTFWAAIVGGIAGIIAGSISSLFAPWVKWGIEKKRRLLKDRQTIIHNAQSMIVDYRSAENNYLPMGSSLSKNSNWMRIKPYLRPEVLKQIEEAEIEPLEHRKVYEAWDALEDEITRLKREWNLV